MLKLSTKHTFYEVYNEWVAESVFIDHKPSKQELEDIRENENWRKLGWDNKPFDLQVFKVEKVYTTAGALEWAAKHSRKYHKRVTKRVVKALTSYNDWTLD